MVLTCQSRMLEREERWMSKIVFCIANSEAQAEKIVARRKESDFSGAEDIASAGEVTVSKSSEQPAESTKAH